MPHASAPATASIILAFCSTAWSALIDVPERVASITIRDWAKVNV